MMVSAEPNFPAAQAFWVCRIAWTLLAAASICTAPEEGEPLCASCFRSTGPTANPEGRFSISVCNRRGAPQRSQRSWHVGSWCCCRAGSPVEAATLSVLMACFVSYVVLSELSPVLSNGC